MAGFACHDATFIAAALHAKMRAECAGELSMETASAPIDGSGASPKFGEAQRLWFVLSGAVCYYFSNRQGSPLGCFNVGACEGFVHAELLAVVLECEGWRCRLIASSAEDLRLWCSALCVVLYRRISTPGHSSSSSSSHQTPLSPMPALVRRQSAPLPQTRVPLHLFSQPPTPGSSNAPGSAFKSLPELERSSSARDIFDTVNSGSNGQQQGSNGVDGGFAASLDRMYDVEVNWRKLKLLEDADSGLLGFDGSGGSGQGNGSTGGGGGAGGGNNNGVGLGFVRRLKVRRRLGLKTGPTSEELRHRKASTETATGPQSPGGSKDVSNSARVRRMSMDRLDLGDAAAAAAASGDPLQRAVSQSSSDDGHKSAEGLEGDEDSAGAGDELQPLFTPPISAEPDAAEIEELVRDSPRFQSQLSEWDREAASVLAAAQRVLKSAEQVLKTNEEAATASQALAADVQKFGSLVSPDFENGGLGASSNGGSSNGGSNGGSSNGGGGAGEGYAVVLSEWRFMCAELLMLRNVLDEQLQLTFVAALQDYFVRDMKGMRKLKGDYDAASNRYALTMQRYLRDAQSLSENEKGRLQVELMMLKEKVDTMGYTLYQQVAAFRLERHLVLLEHLFAFMALHTSYFHHGYHSLKANEADVNLLREEVQRKRITARGRQANIRSVYLDLRNKADTSVADESLNTISALQGSGLKKEGWLTKLSNSHGITGSGLQRWKRKWFVVENGRLGYRRDANSTTMTDTKGNLDLMLTTVKLQSKGRAAERAFTFEVICASPQTHWQLQAESEQDRREWAHALQTVTANLLGISVPHAPAKTGKSFNNGSGNGGGNSNGGGGHGMGSGMLLLEGVPAFQWCCECGSSAEWASINLGVSLCLECSGAHRSIGVHVTQVRSLAMDAWPDALLSFMRHAGNAANRRVWEAGYNDNDNSATSSSPDGSSGSGAGVGAEEGWMQRPSGPGNVERKKAWCVAKYVERRWVHATTGAPLSGSVSSCTPEELGALLHAAIAAVSAPLAEDGPSLPPPPSGAEGSRSSNSGSALIEKCMMLLANGAPVNWCPPDKPGCTPLHAATVQALAVCREDAAARAGQGGSNEGSSTATSSGQGRTEVALAVLECLVLNGGSINAQDGSGKAPMHYAAEDPHGERVLAWLIGHKASPSLRDHQGFTPAALALARGGDHSRNDNNLPSAASAVLVAQQQAEADGGDVAASPPPADSSSNGSGALAYAGSGSTPAAAGDHGSDDSDDDDGNVVVHSGSSDRLSVMQQQQANSSGSGNDGGDAVRGSSDVQSAAALVAAVETVPYPWKALIDFSSGDTYYFNHLTNATSWDLPSEDGTATTAIDTDL